MRKFLPALLCGAAVLSFSAFAADQSPRGQASHDEKLSGATGTGGQPDSAEASGGHDTTQGPMRSKRAKEKRDAGTSSSGAGQSSHDEPRSGATGQGGMPDSAEASGGHDTTQGPTRKGTK